MNEKIQKIYPRTTVFNETLKYFDGDDLAAEVWINKYCLKDSHENLYEKSPDDMHIRLSEEIARIENKYPNPLSKEEIYETLKEFKRIVPQGSPMSGIGNNFQTTSLSNCFVIGNEKDSDSYGGIMKLDQEMVQLQKRRAGVGIDLSFIRPKGTPVKNSAITSTGVVPFMERYSNSTREVAQDGRRGALMESISIMHPDAESFIDAKLVKGKVTGANVSVKITDDFMKAVKNDELFIQHYPVEWNNFEKDELTTGFYVDFENKELVENKLYTLGNGFFAKVVNAKRIWEKIIHNSWKSAEPGVLFWDTIIKESVPDSYADLGFKTISTNPCFSGNERLLTTQGYRKFEDLCDLDDVEIINFNGNVVPTKIWNSGVKNTIKFINANKEEVICTPDHIWMTNEGEECEAKDLKGKRLMSHLKTTYNHDELFVKLGFIQGDGGLGRLKSSTHKGFEINIGNDDEDVLKYFGYTRKDKDDRKFYTDEFYEICENLGFCSESLPIRKLPSSINGWSEKQKLSFLKGLFSANGSVISKHRVSFKTTNKDLVFELQNLLKEFNINTYFTTNKPKNVKFSNGTYLCKESYDINFGRYDDLINFYNKIGFIHEYKTNKLIELLKIKSPKINKIINNGEIKVYDFIEPETHWGIVNGYVSHNCGEITLCARDSCRLLALNLYGYVENPFTAEVKFNWELFKSDVIIGQRYMDDIIDLEIEKIDAILTKIELDPEDEFIKQYEKDLWLGIKEKAKTGRRTGIGVTGEGDMLAALGLRYGTDEANLFSEEVHKQLKLSAYRSSVILAKERGEFPIYDYKREANNPFIIRIKNEDPSLYDDMIIYGRRNIALLTIAPTGTVSLMTQTTSGIESVFLPVHKRRRKINPQEKNVKVDFVDDEGISWQEYSVFHHKFKTWLEINDYDVDVVKTMSKQQLDEIVKKSPYYKATSNDVDWVKKVEMQGKIQKNVDHSISVTVNLPNDIDEDIVAKVFETAHQVGCKGITIYRDGSRSGVLINNDDNEKENNDTENHLHDNHAPKRPKRLKGDIIRFQNNLEKWIAVVGLLDGRPYELFVGRLENGLSNLSPSIIQCEIVKNIIENENGEKKKRYDIEYVDSEGVKQIHTGLNHTFNPEYWNYAKLISSVLRHGMPLISVYELIRSLNLHDEHLNTWKAGIERVIKKYIKDGEKAKGQCPECGGENFEFKEGCLMCVECSWSKCG